MSSALMKRVWHVQVKPTEKLVLMRLAWSGNDDGTGCRRAVADLAAAACVWPRTVKTMLHRMVDTGWLEVQEKARQHRATTYRLVVDALPGVISEITSGTAELDFQGGSQGSPLSDDDPAPGVILEITSGPGAGLRLVPPRGDLSDPRGDLLPSRGDPAGSPDQCDQCDQVQERTPAAAGGSSPTNGTRPAPGTDVYKVVQRLTWDVVLKNPDEGTESGLTELVKRACAQHGIDVGPHSEPVHKAVRSVLFQHEKQQLEHQRGGAR